MSLPRSEDIVETVTVDNKKKKKKQNKTKNPHKLSLSPLNLAEAFLYVRRTLLVIIHTYSQHLLFLLYYVLGTINYSLDIALEKS